MFDEWFVNIDKFDRESFDSNEIRESILDWYLMNRGYDGNKELTFEIDLHEHTIDAITISIIKAFQIMLRYEALFSGGIGIQYLDNGDFLPIIKCHVKTKFAPLEYIEGICEDESMGKKILEKGLIITNQYPNMYAATEILISFINSMTNQKFSNMSYTDSFRINGDFKGDKEAERKGMIVLHNLFEGKILLIYDKIIFCSNRNPFYSLIDAIETLYNDYSNHKDQIEGLIKTLGLEVIDANGKDN